jgi:hypothetical protein
MGPDPSGREPAEKKGLSMTPGPSLAILVAAKHTRSETVASPIDDIVARLEQLGPTQVRLIMSSGGLPPHWNVHIAEWLAIKDQEERRLSASSQAEQIEIARAASSAAERAAVAAERASAAAERQAVAAEHANTRATIALAIAIISITATIIGMIVTHFDAVRSAMHP